jgi:hypothetical protein
MGFNCTSIVSVSTLTGDKAKLSNAVLKVVAKTLIIVKVIVTQSVSKAFNSSAPLDLSTGGP